MSSPGQAEKSVSVLPPLQGLPSLQPPSAQLREDFMAFPGSQHTCSERGDRQKTTHLKTRRKKNIKSTDTIEKMQIATQQQEKGKAAVPPWLREHLQAQEDGAEHQQRIRKASSRGTKADQKHPAGWPRITATVAPVFQRQD